MKKRFIIRNLNVFYGKNHILKNISLDINDTDFFVIIGPNGSGKSTLIKSMARINNTYFGTILFNNKFIKNNILWILKFKKIIYKIFKNTKKYNCLCKDITSVQRLKNISMYKTKELAKHLSYVPQIAEFPENTSIYDFVKMGAFPNSNLLGIHEKNIDIKIKKVLSQVDILDIAQRNISSVSGGQQQRALIAMSLLQNTNTIILDEPTNHLDIKSQLEIAQLLHKLHHMYKKTIILVTHDLNLGIKYANRICILQNGSIAAYGHTKDIINEKILTQVFGVKTQININEHNEIRIDDISLIYDDTLHH